MIERLSGPGKPAPKATAPTLETPTPEEWKGPLQLALDQQLSSAGWTRMDDGDARRFEREETGAILETNTYGTELTVLKAGPPHEYTLYWKRGGEHMIPTVGLATVPHPEGASLRMHVFTYALNAVRKGDAGSPLTIGKSTDWQAGGYEATPDGWIEDQS